jgi:hypothetical protein
VFTALFSVEKLPVPLFAILAVIESPINPIVVV